MRSKVGAAMIEICPRRLFAAAVKLKYSHYARGFSNETVSHVSEERARKLKALFGVTAATDGQKPLGMPIKSVTRTTLPTAIANKIEGRGAVTDGADKGPLKEDEKESAEKAWLESGYIEYMDHQRNKGWKS